MHIPDGFVDGGINAITYGVSAVATAAVIRSAGKSSDETKIPLIGVTAAFIFAAQMVNFPIAAGTSGHFLGAMLASIISGPLNGFLIIAVVLIIQCLGFADGGITALGSNLFNMGIVGGIVPWLLFRIGWASLPKTRTNFILLATIGSWLSVVLASASCSLMLALSDVAPWQLVFAAMVGAHSIIGIGEAIIMAAILNTILSIRPDILDYYQIKSDKILARIA